jgi:dTDP-4-dehydrorhamnose 3,5-epimerase
MRRGVLRGLHYQIEHAQGKPVRAVAGEVRRRVDLRRSSRLRSASKSMSCALSAANKRMVGATRVRARLPGVSTTRSSSSKTTDYWFPEHERTLLWNDPAAARLAAAGEPVLAAKDAAGTMLSAADTYAVDEPHEPAPHSADGRAARSATSLARRCPAHGDVGRDRLRDA